MKKMVLLFTCMFAMVSVFAQTNFQELTLEKALEKARGENKKVFVDCYTSWCGPCKMMAEKILPLPEVGAFMNENFICVKYDMEKSEGRTIQQQYKVSAFPTFLVLDADGNLLHAIVGASATGEEFLAKVKEAFDENSIGKLTMMYEKGNRDKDFLMNYIKALVKACDVVKAQKVSQEVLSSLSDEERCSGFYWFIYENLDLSPVGSENMEYLLKNIDSFRQRVGVMKVDSVASDLFAIQLEDILRGRNVRATLEDVDAIEKRLESCRLKDQKLLNNYIALIKAVKAENTDEVIKLYKGIFTDMEDGRIAYLYFSPITSLKGKWSDKQIKKLGDLTKKIAENVKSIPVQGSLMSFANITIPRLGQ